MRVASNKLKDLIDFFYSELITTYEETEIEALVNLAIENYLGFSKNEIVAKQNENLNQSDLLKLYDCCKDLKKNRPIQYILGEAWFYNLKFKVTKDVLIPRPETEELVDIILKENNDAKTFLDLGCGSGCIPVTLAKNKPSAQVFACDISKETLLIAKKNSALNKTDVTFFESDILNPEELLKNINENFDVIVSNPPYIKEEERVAMSKHVLLHEPSLALFVKGADDIIFYRKIIEMCSSLLKENGKLYFELNPLTADAVNDFALTTHLFKTTELIKDMSGKVRFFRGIKA